MNDFFMFMGITATIAIVVGLIIALYYGLADLIDRWKWNYQYKHRFDKSPTAKCYCVDCKHHNNESNQCYRFSQTTKEYYCTADNWFCWEAEPRKKE